MKPIQSNNAAKRPAEDASDRAERVADLDKLTRLLARLSEREFYGDVEIKMHAGRVQLVEARHRLKLVKIDPAAMADALVDASE